MDIAVETRQGGHQVTTTKCEKCSELVYAADAHNHLHCFTVRVYGVGEPDPFKSCALTMIQAAENIATIIGKRRFRNPGASVKVNAFDGSEPLEYRITFTGKGPKARVIN